MSAPLYLVLVGGALVFFLPGYTIAKALFPEWRVRGTDAGLTAVKIVTLSFVTSVALTILVGFGLLSVSPEGFQASWSDPVLEAWLAGIAIAAFAVGWFRGAYRKEPPKPAARPAPPIEGEDGAWELQRRLDALRQTARRLEHELRVAGSGSPEGVALKRRIEEVEAEARALRVARQAEYAR